MPNRAGDDPEVQPAPGWYDAVITEALAAKLQRLGADQVVQEPFESEEAHAAVGQYLERLIVRALGSQRGDEAVTHQRQIVESLLATLSDALGSDWVSSQLPIEPLSRLLAVGNGPSGKPSIRPQTPLARSALLTGTRRDPSLASQLAAEFAQADRVDILCSFIRWSGLRLLLDALRELTSRPDLGQPRLRVISTSYLGATEPRAIEALAALPQTEVRISYDTERTRLHAKAYLVHRATGFGSAYVGSANVSSTALNEGLEWTTKVSQYELPQLWQQLEATFETYWHDAEFELYRLEEKDRLRQAIAREQLGPEPGAVPMPLFDLRPYPFQEEILEVLAAERENQGKSRHLVVAATGTGKTMMAAFDYRQWSGPKRPRLLFVAHREEILQQALGTFRAVLRDQNFGELLVGQHQATQRDHLFCSIQSLHRGALTPAEAQRYEYVVIDEFHHAAAPSYRQLLETIEPAVLLGLTATPERSDDLDVLHWFGGETSVELRLPDAINRRLLCPFQYFGISDSESLDGLRWQRGGYHLGDLDQIYTGNHVRARLVIDKVREILGDARHAHGLGFCVSVAHARFMAEFFRQHGLPATAVSGDTPADERKAVRGKLARGELAFVFAADLYNEGVDIPEIDTVLFLRPTESPTIYLQQLGRGLRLHPDKEFLTVLDFIAAHRREYRLSARFEAMTNAPLGHLERQLEEGFPYLPAGCSIKLERVAQERVLENLRQSVVRHRSRLLADLRGLAQQLQRPPTLDETTAALACNLDDLLRRGLWSRLLSDAGVVTAGEVPDEAILAKGLRRVAHWDAPQLLRSALAWLTGDGTLPTDPVEYDRLAMLLTSLWGAAGPGMSLPEAAARLRANSVVVRDVREFLETRLRHCRTRRVPLSDTSAGPLELHASYTRDEVLIALGYWQFDQRIAFREGVLHVPDRRVDALFITLHKTEAAFSPSTRYKDYAIDDRLFHWQSQSTTGDQSPTGQRYIQHRRRGYTPLLFVRSERLAAQGLTAPYAFLGPARYVSHTGSRPMSIIWQLEVPMPARLGREARQVAGA